MLEKLLDVVLNPFLDWMLLAAVLGQFAKTKVWTKKRAATKGKFRWFWLWARRTLPFHPVVTGVAIGFAWQSAGWELKGWEGHAALYFAAAGVFAAWGFDILKALFKPLGVEIDPKKLFPSEAPPDPADRDTPTDKPE